MRTSHFANIQPSLTSIASTPDTILYVELNRFAVGSRAGIVSVV